MSLAIVPLDLDEANALVDSWHRHHDPKVVARFAIGVAEGSRICGAAVIGNPVARGRQDGWTLEVNRCVTDGTKNACSALYGAAWRAARAMGYRRIGTYILGSEPGTSLIAAGYRLLHTTKGGNWNTAARPRVDTDEVLRGQKQLWEAAA